jgi:hypothetical protein
MGMTYKFPYKESSYITVPAVYVKLCTLRAKPDHSTNTSIVCTQSTPQYCFLSLINYFLAGLFLTSSSLQACNIILFGCPGVIPEWPLDQSYETAYAKMEPLRLKAVAAIGPGEESNAGKYVGRSVIGREEKWRDILFRRVRASLSQKWIVPSEPDVYASQ